MSVSRGVLYCIELVAKGLAGSDVLFSIARLAFLAGSLAGVPHAANRQLSAAIVVTLGGP
jgi:hypothetical protein